MNRRTFLKQSALGLAGASTAPLWAAPHIKSGRLADKVFVLGLDGMDPVLLHRFVQRGQMPAFARLMRHGYTGPLATTMPAQSPVAWSSFITGTNPGGHGIFDFINRDPGSLLPQMSTARHRPPPHRLEWGDWSMPLGAGRYQLQRRGPAFWHYLAQAGIDSTIFKIPANFPVDPGSSRSISGMGTPDLLGTYGTFTLFTDQAVSRRMAGGRVVLVELVDHKLRATLDGPAHPLRTDGTPLSVGLGVRRDPHAASVYIELQGHRLVLDQGEWSEWLPIRFEVLPLFASVAGMVRLYAQQVHPGFRLYVSPINIDPADPEIPLAHPAAYSRELSQAIGRFYTQGFPEDTKALSTGVFSDEEFLVQSRRVLDERQRAFAWELDRFNDGLFFFYVSSLDQNSHMLYRTMDPTHPLYRPDASPDIKNAVYSFYRATDDMLAQVMGRMDDRSVVVVMSDHGFAPFVREFNLSTWLVENGYTAVKDPHQVHTGQLFDNVDWERTTAFALGLNGLYINVAGREAHGCVPPDAAPALIETLISRLNSLRDPQNGQRMIRRAASAQQLYSGPFMDTAPDIVVGYEGGYRISDAAALGAFPPGLVTDRTDKWSADHCLAPSVVPGVLLSNRPATRTHPAIWDLAPSILHLFGLDVPATMDGRPVL